ncbi:MAG: endolytic transglycosylase MltG [Bacteroidales bacterium]|nr:endolytic transglycosylase MltG [Bacteroidales bacterium]
MLKKFLIFLLIIAIGGGIWAYYTYKDIYGSNVQLGQKEFTYLYIPTGSNYNDLISIFKQNNLLEDIDAFEKVAKLKSFENVKAGRYKILNHMSNNALIGMLRIGDQAPVNITFNHVRTLNELAGKMTRNLEIDSLEFSNYIKSSELQKKYGFSSATFISMFLANTYQVFWNISKEELLQRMADEYKAFWNKNRKKKARQLGLSQSEVSTLASIVQLESLKSDEQPIIAGVYLNRLKKKMPLQADPTVIFALGDFSVQRVLKAHLGIDSPYNTYKYAGLPPGPIYLCSPRAIDAVLNHQSHNYIYFCAKEDFSGYHNFSTTYNGHLQNAKKYQQALNKRKIYR